MADIFWTRAQFKERCKVWVQSDSQGKFVVRSGKVAIKYTLDGRKYDANAESIFELEDAGTVAGDDAKEKVPDVRPEALTLTPPPTSSPAPTPPAAPGDRVPVVIYTDGASLGNPGRAGCGVRLFFRGKEKLASRFLGIATSNVAELEGIRLALELMKDRRHPVDIYTDSKYVIGMLSQGWKAKENVELIAELRQFMSLFSDVRLVKVKGHAGIGPNELVDQLAGEAARTGEGMEEERPS